MNTKQLGLMLVAGLLSIGASAQVDLNPDTTKTPPEKTKTVVVASENTIGKTGVPVSGTAYNVTGEIGFIIPKDSTYYGRIDLGGGAHFDSDVADNFSATGVDDLRASGGKNTGSVILSLAAEKDSVAVDAKWELKKAAYRLYGKGTVSFTYRLYESATDAISGGNNALSTQSADLVTFADATSMAGAASNPPKIDVATSSVKYETGNSTTHVMKINVKNVLLDQVEAAPDGKDLTLNDVVASVTLTATGNFTAVAEVTKGGPAGKVWLDRDSRCTPNHAAGSIDDDKDKTLIGKDGRIDDLGEAEINVAGLEAVVTLTNAKDTNFDEIKDAYLCMQTNGVSEISEGSYTGVLSMKAATAYTAIADVSFSGSTLEKNSESADLDFLLSPEGVFRNYVRLTNTSSVQGSNLMVTLINDAGDSVSFDLGDAGVSDELGPRASTPLININDLYAAAQAEDPTFTVTGEGMGDKLRAKFEGSVPAGHLQAQALSVSTDNTTFFTF